MTHAILAGLEGGSMWNEYLAFFLGVLSVLFVLLCIILYRTYRNRRRSERLRKAADQIAAICVDHLIECGYLEEEEAP